MILSFQDRMLKASWRFCRGFLRCAAKISDIGC